MGIEVSQHCLDGIFGKRIGIYFINIFQVNRSITSCSTERLPLLKMPRELGTFDLKAEPMNMPRINTTENNRGIHT